MVIYEFFIESDMFKVKVVGRIKTRILCPITFLPANFFSLEVMRKNMGVPDGPKMT